MQDMLKRPGNRIKDRSTAPSPKRTDRHIHRWLRQLAASAALFIFVFVASDIIPQRLVDLSGRVRDAITGEADFAEAFYALGADLSSGAPVREAMANWCGAVFYPDGVITWEEVRYRGCEAARKEISYVFLWDGTGETFLSYTLGGRNPEETLPQASARRSDFQ